MNSIEEGQPKVNLAQIFKEVMSGLPQTNWWVVTGGPSTGKTTLLELLSNYGYNTKPEAARVFIDQELEKGRSIQQIRGDEKRFQEEVLNLKYETDEATNENETVIWDRGTDGDSIAYYPDEISYGPANSMKSYDHHLGEPAVIEIRRRYKGIFIFSFRWRGRIDLCKRSERIYSR